MFFSFSEFFKYFLCLIFGGGAFALWVAWSFEFPAPELNCVVRERQACVDVDEPNALSALPSYFFFSLTVTISF